MVTSLFKYERIHTTDAKAKALRGWADHLVTLAKRGDLHARRQALSIIREKDVVQKLFEDAAEKFGNINGGYTRIVKLGRRPGDAAPVCLVELNFSEGAPKKKKAAKKKDAAQVEPSVQAPVTETASERAPESVKGETDAAVVAAGDEGPTEEEKAETAAEEAVADSADSDDEAVVEESAEFGEETESQEDKKEKE